MEKNQPFLSRREVLKIATVSGVTAFSGLSVTSQATAYTGEIEVQDRDDEKVVVGESINEYNGCKERDWTGTCQEWYTDDINAKVGMSVAFDPKMSQSNLSIHEVSWYVQVEDRIPIGESGVDYYVEKIYIKIQSPDRANVLTQNANYFRQNPDKDSDPGTTASLAVQTEGGYRARIWEENKLLHRSSAEAYTSSGSLNLDVRLNDYPDQSPPYEYDWTITLEVKLRQNVKHHPGETNYIYYLNCEVTDVTQIKTFSTSQ